MYINVILLYNLLTIQTAPLNLKIFFKQKKSNIMHYLYLAWRMSH